MNEEILEKLNQLQKSVDTLMQLQLENSNALTTKKEVASFLGVTIRTISNYIKDGKLKEGIHFIRNGVKRITFIPDEIVKFKNQPIEKEVEEFTKIKEIKPIQNKAVSRLIAGVA